MANETRKTLEERARRAILQYAFFRPESALVLAGTIVLTALSLLVGDPASGSVAVEAFAQVPWFAWLLGGLLGEAAIVYSSLTDAEAHQRVVAAMLEDEFQPARLQSKDLQEQVRDAFKYRSLITAALSERRDTVLRDQLADTAAQLDDWLEEVYGLAQRLDRYRRERSLHQQNWEHGHRRLAELQQLLQRESNPALRQDIEFNIASLQRQLDTIKQLENAMERARLRLESTLTAMSTIYTQTMLVGAKDIDSGRARRLQDEIAEEVNELSDVLVAMDEVYSDEPQLMNRTP
ncbi:MAG: hypothetical protein RRC07_00960 [Anaerolineae bacterium]|nr:hypothetical protein [Anaerolineae bacterium]